MINNISIPYRLPLIEPYISCPHCSIMIEVLELNCKIFRCGIYKSTGEQINPHLSKIECDNLVKNDEIYGCGKPFQIVDNTPPFIVKKCDYI